MGNPIFISYRRDDTEGEAGRLFDDLTREFGSQNVFMDVAGIRPGVDFVKAIESNVADCGVLLAVIGPTWATITNADGARRLNDPNDFVVLEIASALKRDVPVIPVLVHGAKMPAPDQLPESLNSFSHRNSVELSHTRWHSDVQLLVAALNSYVQPVKEVVPEPVHATVPVQLPPPHQPEASTVPRQEPKRSSTPWITAIAAIVVVAAGAIAYVATQRAPQLAPQPSPQSAPSPSPQPAPQPVPQQQKAQPQPTPKPTPAPPSIVGTWKLPGRAKGDADTLNTLVISSSGSNLTMRASGSCQSGSCDWGTQPAAVDGQAATATFKVFEQAQRRNRVASVRVSPAGSNLEVQVQNTFTEQGGGTRSNHTDRTFIPGP